MKTKIFCVIAFTATLFQACQKEVVPIDPATAERVSIDRFSDIAGTLYTRSAESDLPGINEAIDFDVAPFIHKGFGPNGEIAVYYNFDVQPTETAPIYVLFKEGASSPVEGQLNIIDVVPGDPGYNDFWNMVKVFVPSDYVANTITSITEIEDEGFSMERTGNVINCPVVPEGSTADFRYKTTESSTLHQGWYKGKAVFYFTFEEKDLVVNLPSSGNPYMPVSGVLVTFNINPDLPGGGPPSGSVLEPGTDQSHSVLETLPEDDDYSPLWIVSVYDNADFDKVSDWESALNTNILAEGVMNVNCPVILAE